MSAAAAAATLDPGAPTAAATPDVCPGNDACECKAKLAGWRKRFDWWMRVWAVLGYAWLVVNIVHVYHSENATGVSLWGYLIYALSGVLWFVYGWFVINNLVTYLAAAVSFSLTVVMIVGVLLYSDAPFSFGGPSSAAATPTAPAASARGRWSAKRMVR